MTKQKSRFLHTGFNLSLVSSLLCSTCPISAFAQSETDVIMLDPIIVSARRFEEVWISSPLATSVIDGEDDTATELKMPTQLAHQVPGLNFPNLGGQYSNFANIRGVGSFSPLSPNDTSVLFTTDERAKLSFSPSVSLFDIDRVEVLRGPQGTLSGRNAQGGAVSVLTHKPEFYDSAEAGFEIGENSYAQANIILNNEWILDTLATRVSVQKSYRGGDIENTIIGGKDGSSQVTTARFALRWEPDLMHRLDVSLSYDENNDTKPRFIKGWGDGDPISGLSPRNQFDRDEIALNLHYQQDLGWSQFHSITSISRSGVDQVFDLNDAELYSVITGLPTRVFAVADQDLYLSDVSVDSISQELRFEGTTMETGHWVAGLHYDRSKLDVDSKGVNISSPAWFPFIGLQDNSFKSESLAIFGEVTVPLSTRLDATFGARVARETFEADYNYDSGGARGVVPRYTQHSELDETFTVGRGILSYHISDDATLWGSVSTGYVPAGYAWSGSNIPRGSDEPFFKASKSTSYEIGYKGQMMNGLANLSLSAFFNDVKNGHLLFFDSSNMSFGTTTLDYQSRGAELIVSAQVAEGLRLSGNIAYTRAELAGVPSGHISGATSGNSVPNVPEWSGQIALDYRRDGDLIGREGTYIAHVDWSYVDSRAADVTNRTWLDSYDLVNLKLGWENEYTSLYVFARNLFDERYQETGYNMRSVQAYRPSEGRTIGIGMNVRF